MSEELPPIVCINYNELLEKYPARKEYLIKKINDLGKKFNSDLDYFNFTAGQVWDNSIKEFIVFRDSKECDKEIIESIHKKMEIPIIESKIELNKTILNQIKKLISRYIDTTSENIEILSLWLLGTYKHKEFETFPLLQLLAQKRSGKTRTLKLLSSLAYKSDGSVSTSPTETHLFRHKEGALFFDEMEYISSKERGAFRETLNAVYKKGNKIVRYKEVKKDGAKEYVEEAFYPYYPLALANISGLGDVLADRSLQIILRRSQKKLTKLVEDFSTNKEILKLKEKLSSLNATIPQNFFSDWNNYVQGESLQNEDLKELFDKIQSTEIYGRSLEIFFPLFIIAYLCDSIDEFLKHAQEYIKQREEEDSLEDIDERLKCYLNSKIEEYSGFVGVSIILSGFRNSLESPEEWINNKWLGRALKRLGFVGRKRDVNGRVQVLLNINPTNSTNTTNTTNTTNPTKKEVELVEYVGFVDKVGYRDTLPKEYFPTLEGDLEDE